MVHPVVQREIVGGKKRLWLCFPFIWSSNHTKIHLHRHGVCEAGYLALGEFRLCLVFGTVMHSLTHLTPL